MGNQLSYMTMQEEPGLELARELPEHGRQALGRGLALIPSRGGSREVKQITMESVGPILINRIT